MTTNPAHLFTRDDFHSTLALLLGMPTAGLHAAEYDRYDLTRLFRLNAQPRVGVTSGCVFDDVNRSQLSAIDCAQSPVCLPMLRSGEGVTSKINSRLRFSQDGFLPMCGRAHWTCVPTGQSARGRGACGVRPNLHQRRGLRLNLVASWRRPTGTATRHSDGNGWLGNRNDQARNIHFMRLAVQEWLGRRIHVGCVSLKHEGSTHV